jgi:two-component system response regulator NreC
MTAHLRLATPTSARGSHWPLERPIRVVLADDHTLMRRSLRLLLDDQEGLDVVAEAADLSAVMRHVNGHQPHVLVLDLGMPNGSSIEAIRRLREQAQRTEIVVLTMEDGPGFAQHALDAGAIGFVLKDCAATDLPAAVRCAVRGHEYVSPRIVGRLASMRRSFAEDKLTGREIEVLRLLALGHTSVEMASKLGLSQRTVEAYRARILRKLGLATRAELFQYALGRDLLAT